MFWLHFFHSVLGVSGLDTTLKHKPVWFGDLVWPCVFSRFGWRIATRDPRISGNSWLNQHWLYANSNWIWWGAWCIACQTQCRCLSGSQWWLQAGWRGGPVTQNPQGVYPIQGVASFDLVNCCFVLVRFYQRWGSDGQMCRGLLCMTFFSRRTTANSWNVEMLLSRNAT